MLVRALGELVEGVGQVELVVAAVGVDLLPDLVGGALVGGEIAEVLVDPVRRQRGGDPLVPPRRRLHVLLPRQRGVPVVAHVVVVEDHRARHRRQQPPVRRVRPRQPVELGVLLVVLELGPRWLLEAAPRLDEVPHLLGGLVGVHLVAEEQHQVRRVSSAFGDREGKGAQRVDAVRAIPVPVVGHTRATGPEGEPQRPPRCARRDHRRRVVGVRLRPDAPAVDLHLVGSRRAGLQVVDRRPGTLPQVESKIDVLKAVAEDPQSIVPARRVQVYCLPARADRDGTRRAMLVQLLQEQGLAAQKRSRKALRQRVA